MFEVGGTYFLSLFKEIEENIEEQMLDDNPKFTFIDRLSDHLQKELGWTQENATNLAIAINYDVNDAGRAVEEYDEIEQCFFRILIKVINRYEQRFPAATVQGILAAGSAMEFKLNL